MFVSDSDLPSNLEEIYFLPYARFYFFENFVIAEICEGVHFTWDMGQELISLALNHYGKEKILGFITNNVHSFSYQPQDWRTFFNSNYMLSALAVVDYNIMNSNNRLVEEVFFESKIKKFTHLEMAVIWVELCTPQKTITKHLA